MHVACVSSSLTAAELFDSLFYGKSQQILSIPGDAPRIKDESFSYLLVNVVDGGQSIYEGLDSTFQDTDIEIEGKPGQRQVCLTEPPRVLQIQLQVCANMRFHLRPNTAACLLVCLPLFHQRVQFDRNTASIYKSNAWMSYPPVIKLDRYMSVDPQDAAGVERQKRSKQCAADLAARRQELARLSSSEVPSTSCLRCVE